MQITSINKLAQSSEGQHMKPQVDKNEIDNAAHEVLQMVEVLNRSVESLEASDKEVNFFRLPAADAELLCFGISDIGRRVKALKEMI